VSFQKCKPFSLIPFAPFSFPACLCFEAQHLKSVDRPSVLPLRTLTALLLAQLRLRNPTARSPLPPLVFSLPAHARCNLLAPNRPNSRRQPTPLSPVAATGARWGPHFIPHLASSRSRTRIESRSHPRPRPPRARLRRHGAHTKAPPLGLLKDRCHLSACFPKP
jgi:hypothetical protein